MKPAYGVQSTSDQAILAGASIAASQILKRAASGSTIEGTDDVTDKVSAATTALAGVVERATQSEVDTGTDTSRYITPETLAAWSGLVLGGKNLSTFELNAVGSSFSTGALGFTPSVAILFSWNDVATHGGSDSVSVGMHNDADALTVQMGFISVPGQSGPVSDLVSRLRPDPANTDWRISAMSSSGVTISRSSGTGTMSRGYLLVFED